MLIARTTIHSGHLTYTNGRYVGEASELERLLRPLYDDACDIGFSINHQGKVEPFYLDESSSKRDNEGDLISMLMYPVNEKLRNTGLVIEIFND